MKKLVKEVTARNEDFAQWYTDICLKAKLMDYSNVKGFIIYRPYSYRIWELIQAYLNDEFRKTGHENVYLPLLIPESLFQKEKDHLDGFAPEVGIVTTTGKEDLAERLIIRPTSEVLFCDFYKKVINSHRDLPILYNQWCSVVRIEKTTRPFLRGSEFLWQEGHTAHATSEEARSEAKLMLSIYERLGRDLLAIPFVTGEKTNKEKFAGAVNTYSIEALMYDGKALQSGTTHYFGQEFAKAFDITFTSKENKLEFVWQSSWGVSTRLIGAIVMVHGDDNGLVLPPYIAPVQIIIIPIRSNEESVLNAVNYLENQLLQKNIRVSIDNSDKSPGFKFSESEMKGIPIRVEIGPRDLENNTLTYVTRFNNVKTTVLIAEFIKNVEFILRRIHNNMYEKAKDHLTKNTSIATNYDEFKMYLEQGGYVKMSIANEEAEIKIKNDTGATARVIVDEPLISNICPITGLKATMTILFARAY